MSYFKSRLKKNINIGLTPLLDVIFILLIFAVLASNFQRIKGIPLELPEVSENTSRTISQLKRAVISIDNSGKLYYNKKNVSLIELDKILKEHKKSIQSIVIKGDKKTPLGIALKVLDLAKRHKYSEVIIVTKTAPSPSKSK